MGKAIGAMPSNNCQTELEGTTKEKTIPHVALVITFQQNQIKTVLKIHVKVISYYLIGMISMSEVAKRNIVPVGDTMGLIPTAPPHHSQLSVSMPYQWLRPA